MKEIKNRILRMLVKRTGRPEYFTEMFLKEPQNTKWSRLVLAYCAKGNKETLLRVMNGYAGGPHDLTEVIKAEPQEEEVAEVAPPAEAKTVVEDEPIVDTDEAGDGEPTEAPAEEADAPAETPEPVVEEETPAEEAAPAAKKRKTTKK